MPLSAGVHPQEGGSFLRGGGRCTCPVPLHASLPPGEGEGEGEGRGGAGLSSEHQGRQLLLVVMVVVVVDVLVHVVGLIPPGAPLTLRGARRLQQGSALQPRHHLGHGTVVVGAPMAVLADVRGARPLAHTTTAATRGVLLGRGWGLGDPRGLLRGGLVALWGALLRTLGAPAAPAPRRGSLGVPAIVGS